MDKEGWYACRPYGSADGYRNHRNCRGIAAVDWKMVVSASLLAGVLSLLNSIVSLPEAKEEKEA